MYIIYVDVHWLLYYRDPDCCIQKYHDHTYWLFDKCFQRHCHSVRQPVLNRVFHRHNLLIGKLLSYVFYEIRICQLSISYRDLLIQNHHQPTCRTLQYHDHTTCTSVLTQSIHSIYGYMNIFFILGARVLL